MRRSVRAWCRRPGRRRTPAQGSSGRLAEAEGKDPGGECDLDVGERVADEELVRERD